MTITEFLLARIAEDEAAANRTAEEPRGFEWVCGGLFRIPSHEIARRQSRVLAECEAKWRFVREAEDQVSEYFTRFILENLATIYADHPDYREEWRP